MIGNLCKKIASYCCCFKETNTVEDKQDNDIYNVFENNVRVTDEKLQRANSSSSFDDRYSLSNEAIFNYSDVYR